MEQVTAVSTARVEAHPRMNWGAIFAGWGVAVGISGLLLLGGLALGFSFVDANDAAATARGIGIGTACWIVLASAASLFVGGMFASWFDGKDDETMGTMHGVAVWGLSAVVGALLSAVVAGHAAHAGVSAIAGGANMLSQAGPSHGQADAIMGTASQVLDAQLKKATSGSAPAANGAMAADAASGNESDGQQNDGQQNDGQQNDGSQNGSQNPQPATAAVAPSDSSTPPATHRAGPMAAVAAALIKGDNDTARILLAADTSLSQAQIDSLVQTESAQVEHFKAKAKQAADRVARYTATALWVGFASSLIGLLAAALGGWLGCNHVHRVYHLRTYRRSVARA